MVFLLLEKSEPLWFRGWSCDDPEYQGFKSCPATVLSNWVTKTMKLSLCAPSSAVLKELLQDFLPSWGRQLGHSQIFAKDNHRSPKTLKIWRIWSKVQLVNSYIPTKNNNTVYSRMMVVKDHYGR